MPAADAAGVVAAEPDGDAAGVVAEEPAGEAAGVVAAGAWAIIFVGRSISGARPTSLPLDMSRQRLASTLSASTRTPFW